MSFANYQNMTSDLFIAFSLSLLNPARAAVFLNRFLNGKSIRYCRCKEVESCNDETESGGDVLWVIENRVERNNETERVVQEQFGEDLNFSSDVLFYSNDQ